MRKISAVTALLLTTLSACDRSIVDQSSAVIAPADGRWYSEEQVRQGTQVFSQNCAVCHGVDAEGTADWRQRLPDGSLPPPPLNGSAHTWHHPRSLLITVINEGGVPFGGQMPAFSEVLNEQEKLAAIAYFQHFWSEEIYASWLQMGGVN